MSWQTYVDEHLMCEIDGQHLTAAAIIGHDGSIWAQSASFPQIRSKETRVTQIYTERGKRERLTEDGSLDQKKLQGEVKTYFRKRRRLRVASSLMHGPRSPRVFSSSSLLCPSISPGFFEFTKVEILSDTSQNHGKPFLKVTCTKNYPSRRFWDAIINACIPVMDLIDWECSHPDGISDLFNTFGIDAAWRYFLGLLKTSISDIGRDLHREHLITVANTLSLTGEFHGLSFKGLKEQRIHASVSSPVSQAFFSSPNTHFVSAAKEGSIDNLLGAVDAVSWGKEPQIGTGGQFDIIYSGKVHELKKVDNIYKSLHSLKQDDPCQKQNELSKPTEHICAKWERMKGLDGKLFPNEKHMEVNGFESANHVSTQSKEHTISGFESKFSSHDVGTLSDVVEMHSSLSRILHNMYKIDEYLNEADKSFVLEALTYHPKGDKKLGAGIRKIKVGRSPTHPGSRCFILIRTDGTIEDMSYRKCVIGAAERISPNCGLMIKRELNHRR